MNGLLICDTPQAAGLKLVKYYLKFFLNLPISIIRKWHSIEAVHPGKTFLIIRQQGLSMKGFSL